MKKPLLLLLLVSNFNLGANEGEELDGSGLFLKTIHVMKHRMHPFLEDILQTTLTNELPE